MAAYNLVGDWAETSEHNLENTVGGQAELSVDSSEQSIAGLVFEAVAKNSGDILIASLAHNFQVG